MTTDPRQLDLATLTASYLTGPGTPPTYASNSTITNLVDGAAYFAAIDADLQRCTFGSKVYVTDWYFNTDTLLTETSAKLGQRLLDLAGAGVDVRLLLWARVLLAGAKEHFYELSSTDFAYVPIVSGFRDVVENNISAALWMRGNSPSTVPGSPLFGNVLLDFSGGAMDGTWHQKAISIVIPPTDPSGPDDGTVIGYVAGMDLGPGMYAEPGHPPVPIDANGKWHDAGVRVEGPAAAEIYRNFVQRWLECKTLPRKHFINRDATVETMNPPVADLPPDPPATVTPAAPDPAQIRAAALSVCRTTPKTKSFDFSAAGVSDAWNDPNFGSKTEIKSVLETAIAAAQNFIYIEDQFVFSLVPGFITHGLPYQALTAASLRGVKIVFVGNEGSSVPIEWGLLGQSSVSQNPGGQPSGAPPYPAVFYSVNDELVHTKVVIVDDVFAMIGSANLYDSSWDGTDGEMSVAYVAPAGSGTVSPSGGAGASPVIDLRAQLWACHLRTTPTDPALTPVETLLGDWLNGTLATRYPNTPLVRVQ